MFGLGGAVWRVVLSILGRLMMAPRAFARRLRVRSSARVAVCLALAFGGAAAVAASTSVQPTSAAGAPPVNTVLPAVTGTAKDGQTLTSTTGTWTGTSITFVRQWMRCDGAGGTCVAITGATATTYVLKPADVGATIRVQVTATNAGGSAQASSAQTAVVAAIVPANTVLPKITGTAKDGVTLTATTGTWNGSTPLGFATQWLRCDAAGANCVSIAGAIASSYTLTSVDVAATVRVRVTASNPGGSVAAQSVQTAVVAATAPANVTLPVVAGTAKEGQTLTGTDGVWSGTPVLSFARQWLRCSTTGASCVNIAGATAAGYVLVAADVGKTLRYKVTATNAASSVSAQSAQTATVTTSAPVNTALPVVSGVARDGQTLTSTPGTWVGTATITTARQWLRCDNTGAACASIAGATAATYVLVAADVAKTIRVRVTATNAVGSTPADSAQTAVVAADPPANTTAPAVSGTARDGQTLSTTLGTWTGTPTLTYSFQWRRCDSAGAGCVNIAAATAQTYTLVSADVTATIRATVTANNAGGQTSASTTQSAVIAPAPPVNLTLPGITGTPRDGSALTVASDGTWSGTTPLAIAYQWRTCDSAGLNCANVAGATGSTYAPGAAQVGSTVRVLVTATNAAGSASAGPPRKAGR